MEILIKRAEYEEVMKILNKKDDEKEWNIFNTHLKTNSNFKTYVKNFLIFFLEIRTTFIFRKNYSFKYSSKIAK